MSTPAGRSGDALGVGPFAGFVAAVGLHPDGVGGRELGIEDIGVGDVFSHGAVDVNMKRCGFAFPSGSNLIAVAAQTERSRRQTGRNFGDCQLVVLKLTRRCAARIRGIRAIIVGNDSHAVVAKSCVCRHSKAAIMG